MLKGFFLFEDSLLLVTVLTLALLPTFYSVLSKRRVEEELLAEGEKHKFEKRTSQIFFILIGATVLSLPLDFMAIEYGLLLLSALFMFSYLLKLIFEILYRQGSQLYIHYALHATSYFLLFLVLSIFLFSQAKITDIFEKGGSFDAQSIYKITVEEKEGREEKRLITRNQAVIERIIENLGEVQVKKRLFEPKKRADNHYEFTLHSHQEGLIFTAKSHYFQVRPNRVYYVTDDLLTDQLFRLEEMTKE